VSKSGLDNILKSILSVANAEQNMAYPPFVFDNHVNIATSFILDKLSYIYPVHSDILLPFILTKKEAVKNGHVDLPDDYRNLLGAPSISVNADGKDCGSDDPVIIDTESEFKSANRRAGCKSVPITIVSKKDWDYRTTSTYAYPTHSDPIGMMVGLKDGKKALKVCPYDIQRVEFMFTKKEKIYRYGYIMQPDDTYIYDEATSEETEWENAAFELLFKAVFALYSAYSRDQAITEWSMILNKAGLF